MSNIPLHKVLKTDRLRLRVVSLSDIHLVWSASRYEGFNDGMVWDPPLDKKEMIPVTSKNIKAWEEGVAFTFTIEIAESNTPVGRIDIRIESEPGVWSIGFWIHPEHQNSGYATEASKELMRFGFDDLRASKITIAHAVWNTSSKRVIEKLRFEFIRENPTGYLKAGEPVPEYEYEIRAFEFRNFWLQNTEIL